MGKDEEAAESEQKATDVGQAGSMCSLGVASAVEAAWVLPARRGRPYHELYPCKAAGLEGGGPVACRGTTGRPVSRTAARGALRVAAPGKKKARRMVAEGRRQGTGAGAMYDLA